MKPILTLALLPILAACATAPGKPVQLVPTAAAQTAPASAPAAPADLAGVLTDLKTRAIADLNAAEADAVAHNDQLSAPCYAAEIVWINSLPAPALISLPDLKTAVGPIQAFQMARDTRHSGESLAAQVKTALANGIPTNVKLGCSALVLDEVTLFNRLVLMAGGAASLNALAPLAPFAGAALPIPIP